MGRLLIWWVYFNKASFVKRDMYSQIDKQRRMVDGNARSTIAYLQEKASDNPALFWKVKTDDKETLLHLF